MRFSSATRVLTSAIFDLTTFSRKVSARRAASLACVRVCVCVCVCVCAVVRILGCVCHVRGCVCYVRGGASSMCV